MLESSRAVRRLVEMAPVLRCWDRFASVLCADLLRKRLIQKKLNLTRQDSNLQDSCDGTHPLIGKRPDVTKEGVTEVVSQHFPVSSICARSAWPNSASFVLRDRMECPRKGSNLEPVENV
jgi:hypothetical protein